jgi:hypothetical protein
MRDSLIKFMNQYHKDSTKNLDQLGRKFSLRKSSASHFNFSEESINDQVLGSNFKSTLYDSKKLKFDSSIIGFNQNNLDKFLP